jgi:hypothetical protein
MKTIFIIIILLLVNPAWSGDASFVFDPNDYDQSTGLLIIPIMATTEKEGLLSYEQQISKNLYIYNPLNKNGRKIFDKYYGHITGYVLESVLKGW